MTESHSGDGSNKWTSHNHHHRRRRPLGGHRHQSLTIDLTDCAADRPACIRDSFGRRRTAACRADVVADWTDTGGNIQRARRDGFTAFPGRRGVTTHALAHGQYNTIEPSTPVRCSDGPYSRYSPRVIEKCISCLVVYKLKKPEPIFMT